MLQSFKLFNNCNLVFSRSCSGYVSRTRYLMRLKEDDEACREALKFANVLLYHKLAPLLQKTRSGVCKVASFKTADLEQILEKVGKDKHFINESLLLGCTDKSEPQFSLEVGEVERSALEQECRGTFVDLRKAFFMITPSESALAAKMSPVVIVLVSDGSRCLLARQAMFPPGMYSALSGFCDMGESVEEALHREVAEEVGLEVENLQYSGSQHWPFPQSSFMLACHATVNPNKTQVNIDKAELEDARWFTLEEITTALQNPPRNPREQPPVFWVPPSYAIANQLIREWANQQQLLRSTHRLKFRMDQQQRFSHCMTLQ
nr:nucleoside diphosphate-linked moiety X motif 13 isoform X2 [Danio rerio]|eukprot:XP_009304775.1 nucleoside diphosphate-linked moiety X motif 13 isoform X2 [Danio rerio]